MAVQNNLMLPGYEGVWGEKKVAILDRNGPSSYNNTGTYATSGDVIKASDLGWGGIEYVIASQSSDGLDEVNVSYPLNGGQALASIALHWFVTSTSAEVANAVDLSGKSIRLYLIGV